MGTTVRSTFPAAFRRLAEGRKIARRVIRASAEKIIAFARTRWPVDTSTSKDALRTREVPKAKGVEFLLIADGKNKRGVEYSPYILSNNVRPFNAYIRVPGLRAARELPAEIVRAIAAHAKRRG